MVCTVSNSSILLVVHIRSVADPAGISKYNSIVNTSEGLIIQPDSVGKRIGQVLGIGFNDA